ncbi:malto-oligosyltrehalose trehalohydrolase [Roseiconus nitratireducens]|uniref:Malto-oligosyltrehalose trehalohydrolase n=1 Tax=Roseiconus nitratireducens TaxID=2605748 RepID=A0A5M6D0H9_9BACT|nr:malto-oligosyltrehalose trehalohydrolase [Roseiconus nitratireducens]KAA5540954.1 malto-oligosyltrehalose trehalohydrolase [Roseiconus nitratireducens]
MTDISTEPNVESPLTFGSIPTGTGATRFSVWAPWAKQVRVNVIGGPEGFELTAADNGIHTGTIDGVGPGARYFYRLDDGPQRPDPASRFQPEGVHGPSEVIDPAFPWTDREWQTPDRDDLIIYELHVGTFTQGGTYLSTIDRLQELKDLGVTAIELMPIAACAGRWNWGYDGVALFAPSNAYGTPDDFRQLVDAAHAAGLAVFLDVVYNHLGPEGNYLNEFGPYLSDRHHTVWGDAPNFDDLEHGDIVRQFFIANAIHWLREYHLDGLRVDAIHCMTDLRDPHIAAEMSDAVARRNREDQSRAILIAESNVYDPEMTVPRNRGGIGFDAMWCDDFLHSVFATLRPDEQLTDRDYRPKTDLAQVLRHGYVFEGTLRRSRVRKELTKRVTTHDLVYSIQNHDFIGNHPLGIRLHQLASHETHRAAAALLMMTPAIPMVFMGEEFASDNPFRFFVDFGDADLRDAVVQGRRREYPQHDWDAGVLPTDPSAFHAAKIGERGDGNRVTWQWYRDLIDLRKTHRQSGLLRDVNLQVQSDAERDLYVLRYAHAGQSLVVAVRLCGNPTSSDGIEVPLAGQIVLDSRPSESQSDFRLHPNHAVIAFATDL